MKIICKRTTLEFQKGIDEISSVILTGSRIVQARLFDQQPSGIKSLMFNVTGCSHIIVDGLRIGTSTIGGFCSGDVVTENQSFPSGDTSVITAFAAAHQTIEIIQSSDYNMVNGDVTNKLKIPVPAGATSYVGYAQNNDISFKVYKYD